MVADAVLISTLLLGAAVTLWGLTRPAAPPGQRTDDGFEPTGLGWNTRARRNRRRFARRPPRANAVAQTGLITIFTGMWLWTLLEVGWDWSERSPRGIPIPVVLVAMPIAVASMLPGVVRLYRQSARDREPRGRDDRVS